MTRPRKKTTALAALFVGILLSFAFFGFSSSPSEDGGGLTGREIKWKSNQRLSWDDFKGKPDRFTYMDAVTESGIVFNWSCDWSGFHTEVFAMFDPGKSWVKRSSASAYLLEHEQAHFDITEIHARKLRKRLSELSNPCRMGSRGIQSIADKVYKESAAMQNLYDEETYHSKNRKKQAEWLKKISSELKRLERWAK